MDLLPFSQFSSDFLVLGQLDMQHLCEISYLLSESEEQLNAAHGHITF